jgi:hypothetical protein
MTMHAASQYAAFESPLAERMTLMRTTVAKHANPALTAHDEQPLTAHDDAAHLAYPQLGFGEHRVSQARPP